MMRRWGIGFLLAMGLLWAAAASDLTIFVGTPAGTVELSLSAFALLEGAVAYEGPVSDTGETNWKAVHRYQGVSVKALLEAAGVGESYDTVGIVAADGWYKLLPRTAVLGDAVAGVPILAIAQDGLSGDAWEDAPMLVFLPGDEQFSNQDMIESVGETFAHYFGDKPSTTGMMVKGVMYLVPDYDGSALPLQPETVPIGDIGFPDGKLLTVVRGATSMAYSLGDVEALETITAPGTFTTSTNTQYTATYTGVPMTTLIGNVSSEATIRVTAADGYSMNYPAATFQDSSEGTWVLAYKEDGAYMPFDPGYFRIVKIGEDSPHFSSALSAKMVTLIEIVGAYEAYSLLVSGVVDRVFSRSELEEGIGCSCHSAGVSVTSKGTTSEYSGLPLWRLLAFVDDDAFPAPELGVYYNDSDFSDSLAETGYTITLVAEDGYTQTVTSDLVARDDRFIVAFKKDGTFLDPASNGFMRFVFDDSADVPSALRSVKFLAEIRLDL